MYGRLSGFVANRILRALSASSLLPKALDTISRLRVSLFMAVTQYFTFSIIVRPSIVKPINATLLALAYLTP
jgi:hypothetical protein